MVEIECKSKTVSQGYYYFSIAKAAKIHSQLLVNTDLSFAVIFIISFDLECHHYDYRKTFFFGGGAYDSRSFSPWLAASFLFSFGSQYHSGNR